MSPVIPEPVNEWRDGPARGRDTAMLTRSAKSEPTGPHSTPMELREVIRRIEAKTRHAPPARRVASLEDLVEGEVEETERGAVLVVRRRFPLDHHHGRAPLAHTGTAPRASLSLLGRGDAEPPEPARLVYLDTETTGLAGGTGTYAFLVGAGFVDGDAFEVRQYFMRDLDEEPALLAAIDALLGRFEGVVTYNGAGFDLPLLETRFVLDRRRWRDDVFHVDLLPAARRLWRDRLADCRLATVESHVLGFARADDLPGALIPYAYFDYLRRKRPGDIPRVFEHNRHDILSLAALTGWVTGAIARAPAPELASWELAGLGTLLEAVEPERGEACFRLALELGLAGAARERLLLRLAIREKRRRRWDEARALWGELASLRGGFDPRPWEEIAKIDEHRRRDLAAALDVASHALGVADRSGASSAVRDGLTHRLARLSRRLSRSLPASPGC